MPFEVRYARHVEDHRLVEEKVHARLAKHRVADGREFFKRPVRDAIEVIDEACSDERPTVNEPVSPYQFPKVPCAYCGHIFWPVTDKQYPNCPKCGVACPP